MKKQLLLGAFILIITTKGFSQLGSFFSTFNYNNYQNTDLKKFQTDILNSIEIPLFITDNFPNYYGFSLGYRLPIVYDDLEFEIFMSNYSTGGKISYSDYSGSISIKQKLDAINIGISGVYTFEELPKNIYLKFGIIYSNSTLNISDNFKIGDDNNTEIYDFISQGFGLNIGPLYEINLRYFCLFICAQYNLYVPSKLKDPDNKKLVLNNSTGNPVALNWSGFQLSAGIRVPIFPWNGDQKRELY